MSAYTSGVRDIEERERLRDARLLAGRAGHGPCRSLKRRQSASGLVLDVTLQAAAGADAWNGGRFKDEYKRLLQLAQLLAEIVQNAVFCEPGGDALFERREIDENDARVRCVGERCAVETYERHRVRRSRPRQNDVGGFADDGIRPVERRSGRKLQGHDQIGAIERRNEACRRRRQPIVSHIKQPGIGDEQDQADADQLARQPSVAVRQASECPVEAAKEQAQRYAEVVDNRARLVAVMYMRLQQQRRHCRRKRQRHDQRNCGRGCDRYRELLEERSLQSGDEGSRQEDADENEGNRDQRGSDFVHRFVGGFLGT